MLDKKIKEKGLVDNSDILGFTDNSDLDKKDSNISQKSEHKAGQEKIIKL